MEAKSCELNAMKMTVMGSDANLTMNLIKEGGVHIPTEDITLPFWKETHAHMDTHIRTHKTSESKTKHLNSSAYTSINPGADGKTYKRVLHWTQNEFLL